MDASQYRQLAEKIKTLPPAKRKLLELRLQRMKESEAAPMEVILPASRDRELPLALAQRRIWFLQQLEPDNPFYNLPNAVTLEGPLDVASLARSLAYLVQRHEPLRTSYAALEGRPRQVIHPPFSLALPQVDLSGLDREGLVAQRRVLLTAEGATPFDLAQAPLIRTLLLRLGPERHVLAINQHHIITDGVSLALLLSELTAIYEMFSGGKEPQLPALTIQYADFAVWQQQWLDAERVEQELSYWRQQLQGTTPLELPTDRPRPAQMTYHGLRVQADLRPEPGLRLRRLGQQHRASFFMVLTAAFGNLLGRLCGTADVAMGTPIAGRNLSVLEGLLGMFVNTLVLRLQLEDPHRQTFTQTLELAREVALGAFQHQNLPFEQLVEELVQERDPSRNPMFQVMFSHHSQPPRTPARGQSGLRIRPADQPFDSTLVDLTLEVMETGDGASLILGYNTDLFDRTTARRWIRRMVRFLEQAAQQPDSPIWVLDRLATAEQHQVCTELPAGHGSAAAPPPLEQGLAQVAAQQPDAVALCGPGLHLSYGELHRRAGLLAADLATMGVGVDSLVGVWAERCAESAIAVLAVLRSGAAYLPLDPAYPAERLAFMLGDSGASWLLCREQAQGELPDFAGRVLALDADGLATGAGGAQRTETGSWGNGSGPAASNGLAYAIYTSGSTGKPKGVGMTRQAMARLMQWQGQAFSHRATARTLQFAALSFDVSFQEMLSTWSYGGTLVLVEENTRRDGRALLQYLSRERVERIFLPFVALQNLAESAASSSFPAMDLRELVTAGEQLRLGPTLRAWLRSLPGAVLHNHYGPSETHVVSSWSLPAGRPGPDLPPIGRPILGSRLQIVDELDRAVGLGVPGELIIGGEGVGRGYLGRPSRTAQAFVPDSIGQGARRYRSGDLARWTRHGEVDFLGRIDQQVKVRGFRVEPGEVEVALGQHPEVAAVAVTVRSDAPGGAALVAYVVAADGDKSDAVEVAEWSSLQPDALKTFLSQRLPAHMMPGFWVPLTSLPRTPSGKVDRRSLPAPQRPKGAGEAPRGEAEQLVAEVYSEVIGVQDLHREDDFFTMGGHSLLATQAIARLESRTGQEISLWQMFQTPTVAGLAAYLAEAATEGEGAAAGPGESRRPPLVVDPEARQQPLPLSFAQERLWFVDRLAPGGSAYNLTAAVELDGALDLSMLEAAISAVVQRHEALRTTFTMGEGGPVQRIAAPRDLVLPNVDHREFGEREKLAATKRLLASEAARPFDLEQGPLLRSLLLRLDEQRQVLLMVMHHIVSDGWSMGVLVREVGGAYARLSAGHPAFPVSLPLQYPDYALWQRRWLEGGELERQLDYWQQQLADANTLLELPWDRSRPPVASQQGGVRNVALAGDALSDLRRVAEAEGATLFMALFAAYSSFLARWSGQQDLLIGSPVAGRPVPELEDLIGFFVNTLVLRARVEPDISGRQLVKQAKVTSLDAMAHQDLPFERLVEAVETERDLSRSPLYQVVLSLQNAPTGTADLPDVSMRPVAADTGASKFDLTLSVTEERGGLSLLWEYSSQLFDSSTIHRATRRFNQWITALGRHPDLAVSQLPVLDRAEQHQLLREWGEAAAPYERTDSIVQRFVAQVEETPDAVALVDNEGLHLSYLALWQRSLRVRDLLGAVEPEERVGLAMERGPDQIAATLAVLAAGAAYVPLDAGYPAARLQQMACTAGLRLVLTSPRTQIELSGPDMPEPGLRMIHVTLSGTAAHDGMPVADGQGGDRLAYLMFTSGSTGEPKGVAVSHRAVLRLVRGNNFLPMSRDSTFLQLAPTSFDAATLEIWAPLLNGGRLVLAGSEQATPAQLGRMLRRQRVTSLWLTAALFHLTVDERAEGLVHLRHLLAGGDALSAAHVRRLFEAGFQGLMVNGYGPTENTTFTTCGRLRSVAELAESVPVGRPISNTTVRVVDASLQPVAIGSPGELLTGGDGLARGYLGAGARSAERFVPDPLATLPGQRLYRTGDLVRFLRDGRLQFLGRLDRQVKVRGFRIEPGEIEHALLSLGGLRQAAVVLRENSAGDARLVAYLVSEGADEQRAEALEGLRQGLEQRLPAHMLPQDFVFLDSLPRTANGKLDRAALPDPEAEASAEGRLPSTAMEILVASTFSEVLGRQEISAEDDFFVLGGHSLLATQVCLRLEKALGIEVPLRWLFQAPSVADFGRVLEAQASRPGHLASSGVLAAIETGDVEAEAPLSFAQERLWFIDQLEPGMATYNVPLILALVGPMNAAALAAALGDVVERHAVLRTVYSSASIPTGSPVQRVLAPQPFHLPRVDLRGLDLRDCRREARRLASEELARPFDLELGPILRVMLLHLAPLEGGEPRQDLVATVHHIASDAWSTGIFSRELGQAYGARCHGRPPQFPPLDIQYADFARWQRQHQGEEALAGELQWWTERLAGLPPVLELPTDRPRPAVASYRGNMIKGEMGEEVDRLRQLASEEGATLYMALLAVFQSLLSRLSGNSDLAVGSPVAGRVHPGVEPLMGFFTNTLVLRGDLSGQPSLRQLLRRTRVATLEAFARQNLPFEQLVEAVAPHRSLAHSPLFQVLLSLDNASSRPGTGLHLEGLRLAVAEAGEWTTAKFDLSLFSWELPGGHGGSSGLDLSLEYARDLFDLSTAHRLLARFRLLTQNAVQEPDRALAELPWLNRAEQHQTTVEMAFGDEAGGESPSGFGARFASMLKRQPEAIAVSGDDGHLSYGELHRRAGRVAQRLTAEGVGPDSIVGVWAERRLQTAVAVLGILRAGAAYLPLDPSYPAERLSFMVEDAGVRHLLHGDGAAQVPAVAQSWSVGEALGDAAWSSEDPSAGSWPEEPQSLAYLIYTSGSTGRPKGVAMGRAAMARLLQWQERDLTRPASARTLQFAALSFDVSFQEMATTWAYGGTLILVDETTRRDGRALLDHLARQRVERLFLPFVALEHLAETALAEDDGSTRRPGKLALRELVTAGEQLRLSHSLRAWLDRLDGVQLHNQYGPSETHVVSSWTLPREGWESDLPPIGKPISGTRLQVVDRGGRAVGLGVPGELSVGGDSVGRGYRGRSALTAASFVPDPIGLGQRQYLTGDMVRWLSSGDLEFLGRVDQQVKVRGFRVEPGEVEAVLDRHSTVSSVAVAVRDDAPGGRALVAYVVPADGKEMQRSGLRAFLGERLPPHMMPSFWVELEALPLTPSGKVDRRGLPAPAGSSSSSEPPRGPMEELVAGVYAEVLAVGGEALEVGREDDFFSLGGHSLKATQVVSRLEQVTGAELSLRTLFQQPTVAALAAWLEQSGRGDGQRRPELVAMVPHDASGGTEPVPLSYAQERMWFLDRLQPGSPAYHLPDAVMLGGDLDIGALERAIGAVVARHGALRSRFLEVDGEPRQQVLPIRAWSLPRVDLTVLSPRDRAKEQTRWTAANHLQPFDLGQGDLLRTRLLLLGPGDTGPTQAPVPEGQSAQEQDRSLLLINMHHIVSDGWSMGVFVRELVACYLALRAGERVALPALPLQYVDFARWQRGMLEAGEAERQLAYWRQELEGAPTALELATDRPRPPVQSVRGDNLTVLMGPELSEDLARLARQEGATMFMVLLAGYASLLSRETGQADVLVGTPIANRNRQEIEGLVGFFVNTLVLRARLGGRPSLRELVKQVRERTLDAYAHQDLPFERLVEGLGLERDLSRPPVFQAMLVLQNAPAASAESSGLRVQSLGGETQTTKFELTLGLEEGPNGLTGAIEYSSDLFDRTTIRRLLGRLRRLLTGAAQAPDQPLAELGLLGPAEQHQLLREWQGSPIAMRVPLVPDFVADMVEHRPSSTAVQEEGRELSFGQLDDAASRVAEALRGAGVGPKSVVAVDLERSTQLVQVLWGVMRLGAAYLPIDPSLPWERKLAMLEDSGARCLVHDQEPKAEIELTQLRPAELLEQAVEPRTPGQGVARKAEPVHAQQLAYLIYTSGSTGRPKGVAVSHGALANLVAWHLRAFRLQAGQRSTQLAGLGFDASVWEIWPALASGGTLVLTPDEVRLSPARLPAWLAEQEIDRAFVPTPLMEAALEVSWPEPQPRLLLTGGDRLRTLPDATFGSRLANCYGPTENAVVATWGLVRQESASGGSPSSEPSAGLFLPSIGRAVDGVRVAVVDRQLQMNGLGVPGELVIGGHSLARGYWGQGGQTAAAFVPDGVWGEEGERLYRTGDLVRTLSDGRLDFLGRVDHQVKVRGFRIELGEIEQVLCAHPRVAQAAVVLDGQHGAKEDRVSERRAADRARLVAYVVDSEAGEGSEMVAEAELRAWLAPRLPEYMVPAVFVGLEQLPLTPNGKLDRRNLPAPPSKDSVATQVVQAREPRDELERSLQELWQEVLEVEVVGLYDSFFDLGGHSLLLAKCQTLLRERLGREVPMVDLFRLPTVADLAEHLRGAPAPKRRQVQLKQRVPGDGAIAVVGMAGRFPGANSVQELWQNLRDGKETVRFFSPEELAAAGIGAEVLSSPGFVPAASLVDEPGHFDAGLFAISPKEARLLDPQQRLFLECAWTALEDASCDPAQAPGPVGVYAGIGTSQYWLSVIANPELAQGLDPLQLSLGNEKDFFATRVAYKLNLKGPSLDVQTACSTSLVATHLACQALQAGDCDLALAGGVSLSGYGPGGYSYQPGGVESPDGHTRSFDSQAQGTVSGSGVGIVVLKRLEDALRDGDSIRAVIRGTAINNDGSDKVGFTAPSVAGQAEAIARAQAVAGVSPEQISYVEAHGSATPLGDPIEVAALNEVFAGHEGEVLLGAVKSNLGHLDAAAGVTGLIKTVMSLQHRQIPPTLHFQSLNPEIEPGPFRVVAELQDWPQADASEGALLAGVSSFGLGGTNAHVVVEEAPASEIGSASRQEQLLLLSGASNSAVQQLGRQLAEHLESGADLELADLAHSLRVGRRRLSQRRAVVVGSRDEAVELLKGVDEALGEVAWLQRNEERQERPVAFLLPGVGDHYVQMGRDLYEQEPTFRRLVDQAHQQLQAEQGLDLLPALYPDQSEDSVDGDSVSGMDLRKLLGRSSSSEAQDQANPLDSTELAQPSVFVLEMALAALWREWGVEPKALIGYSLGEYSAACLAGVFSFEEGLRLVAERARLIQSLPAGGMLAVPVASTALLEESGLADLFEDHPELAVAAHNGPQVTVLSGPLAALEAVEVRLREQGQVFQRLSTGHAFHSPMMQPIVAAFRAVLEGVDLQAPQIPYLSNVTGGWVSPEQVQDPEHWIRHLCGTVHFAEGLETLLADSSQLLLEVGPGQALSTAARQHPSRQKEQVVLASLRDGRERVSDHRFLLASVGRVWLAGGVVDWQGFVRHEQRRRRPVPTYPFERQRYWAQSEEPGTRSRQASVTEGGTQGRVPDREDVGTWFSAPMWRESTPAARARDLGGQHWLLVGPPSEFLSKELHGELQAARAAVRLVTEGPDFEPQSSEAWRSLIEEAREQGGSSSHLVLLPGLGSNAEAGDTSGDSARSLTPFLALGQALTAAGGSAGGAGLQLHFLTRGAWDAPGGDQGDPIQALALGAALVLPREVAGLEARVIDLPAGRLGPSVLRNLGAELAAAADGGEGGGSQSRDSSGQDDLVALRGGRRWVQKLEPQSLPTTTAPVGLRQGGVYLIVGGFGRMGRAVAEAMARAVKPRLILLGRTELPKREQWPAELSTAAEGEPLAERIRQVHALESLGAEVHTVQADVADAGRMEEILSWIREELGELHGVLHLAGVVGGSLLAQETTEGVARVLRPKVDGTRVLAQLLGAERSARDGGLEPDFLILASSLLGSLGVAGQLAPSAASAYLDAHAQAAAGGAGPRTLSLDWDAWHGATMESGITDEEGSAAFLRALTSTVPQLLVSPQDVQAMRTARVRPEPAAGGAENDSERHARPELGTPYVEPSGELEEALAKVWRGLLGLDRVGADDNFLELGGDSLIGLQVLARIREDLGAELEPRDLFAAPTVRSLASRVQELQGSGTQSDLDDLESLLDSIEEMSDEDVLEQIDGGSEDES